MGQVRGINGKLPFNRSFFCCVDFCDLRYVTEQKAFYVVKKEVLSVGTGEIEAVVVDDLCLLLQPSAPTRLANLGGDALPEGVGERSESERWPLLPAVCAFDCICHFSLLEIGPIGPIEPILLSAQRVWPQYYHCPSA